MSLRINRNFGVLLKWGIKKPAKFFRNICDCMNFWQKKRKLTEYVLYEKH